MKKSPLPPEFSYKKGHLYFEQSKVESIANDQGTPLYVYSKARILENFHRFDKAFKSVKHLVLFAMKANSNAAVLSVLGKAGAGADIVSGGELFRARRAGIPPERIVFAGVGKKPDEIRAALEANILMFNVESVEELESINRVATALQRPAPVSIRINPDIDAMTHGHITTGKKENKFGIPIDSCLPVFRLAAKLPRIRLLGVHAHIGSQITSTRPFAATLDRVLKLVDTLEKEGITLRYMDLGGGLGVRYKDETPPNPAELAEALAKKLKGRDLTLLFEPGRFIVGDAGLLITKVIYRKDVETKHFVVVDAAMNDLARPALYDAYHGVYPTRLKKGKTIVADIVGPVCESSDYLARNREIVSPDVDALFVIATAGAYGFVMGSQYNSRPRCAEVMVDGNRWYVVKDRESLDDLVRGEHIPENL